MRRLAILLVSSTLLLGVPAGTAAAVPNGTHDGPDGVQSQYTCAAWGWAVDLDDLNSPVTVRVLVDGSEVARVVADAFRQDLLDRAISPTGKASFNVPLWQKISHDAWHEIRVEGLDTGSTDSWAPLNLTPRKISCHEYSMYDYDLFLKDVATGKSTRLTTSAARGDWNPAWSPDGTRLAHDVAIQDPSQLNGVRSFIGITPVATGRTRAVSGTSGGNDASWSPDGKRLAFDRVTAGDRSTYTISPSGGTRRLVRHNAVSADYSPSGTRMVFLEPSTSRIVTMDPAGGHPIVVVRLRTRVNGTAAFYDVNPEWSPDGRWITYADSGQIWKVRVKSNGTPLASPLRMTKGRPVANGPTWAADSSTIVFQAPYEEDNSKLWSIAAVGGVPTKLTNGSGLWGFGDANGAFSPSGGTLAYSAVAPIVPN